LAEAIAAVASEDIMSRSDDDRRTTLTTLVSVHDQLTDHVSKLWAELDRRGLSLFDSLDANSEPADRPTPE
jgi:hypothetical protein